jgi:hypothetical protein
MSFVGKAIGSVVGGITGATDQAKAAQRAGDTQYAAAMAGIDEQRRQFDTQTGQYNHLTALMFPFIQPALWSPESQGSINETQFLLGLRGPEWQKQAIDRLQNEPAFMEMIRQGEDAILQNASATGGLRGGNTQAALAQFRPQMLRQSINERLDRLNQMTGIAQNSVAGQGAAVANYANAGGQSAANISNLLQQGGAAQAGGILAKGSRNANAFGDLLQIVGAVTGASIGGSAGSAAGSGNMYSKSF